MKYLLDTHALLWWLNEPERLSPPAQAIIENDSLAVMVSIVSAWEIATKSSLGKINSIPGLENAVLESGLHWLPVLHIHVESYRSLPHFRQHRDPFDRMLIAQALAEGLAIVTRDPQFRNYGAPLVPA